MGVAYFAFLHMCSMRFGHKCELILHISDTTLFAFPTRMHIAEKSNCSKYGQPGCARYREMLMAPWAIFHKQLTMAAIIGSIQSSLLPQRVRQAFIASQGTVTGTPATLTVSAAAAHSTTTDIAGYYPFTG
jgi:hypothetical protein